MNKLLHYKAHICSVRFSASDGRFYGKIESIPETVTFEATTIKRLTEEFEKAVDYYLKFCQEVGNAPSKYCTAC
jgi:predicted HicB family RNase H-like nuclease